MGNLINYMKKDINYEIERCSVYDNCEKIDNIRRMCERKKEANKAPNFGFSDINPVKWCNPSEAGTIIASVRLYDLFDNYDKNSTKLSKNMLNYTKNMHNLTRILLIFTIVGFILTFINTYIAYLQLVK